MVKTDLITKIFTVKDQEGIQMLSNVAAIRHCAKDEIIYAIGDIQTNIYILLNGVVYSYFIDETQTAITDCFITECGYPVSTENFELPSMFSTKALVETDLLELPIEAAMRLMQQYPEMVWEYVRLMQMAMTFHWYIAQKRIHYPANKKYEWFRENWPEVDKLASNYQIASFLGIRPESLSRLRQLAKKKGHLVKKKRI